MTLMSKIFGPTNVVALQKIIQAITGLGTAFMVAHFLSAEEQGYFYTMGSLLSSYVIFDLGLSSVILRRSSQICHGVPINKLEKRKKNEFNKFAVWTIKFYLKTAGFAVITLLLIGLYILSRNNITSQELDWKLPWIFIVIMVSVNMPTIGFLSMLEGSGAVSETYTLRITHYLIGGILTWLLIISGKGLFAQAMPFFGTIIVCYSWFFFKYFSKFKVSDFNRNDKVIFRSLRPDIKFTASNWISNYIFINIPIIISFLGNKISISGQIGLSIIIANVGGAIAFSPLTEKLPKIIQLLHVNENARATQLLFEKLRVSVLLYILGSLIFLAMSIFSEIDFFKRILNSFDLGILLLVFAGFHTFNFLLLFLQARGNNKLSIQFLISNICLGLFSGIILNKIGILGFLLSMAICIFYFCYQANKEIIKKV